jgi:hypothetical protein
VPAVIKQEITEQTQKGSYDTSLAPTLSLGRKVSFTNRLFTLLFSWLVLLGTVRAAEFPRLSRIPEGIGVNIHFTSAQPGEMEMLAAAGFRWVRMDFAWSAIEKSKGQYDFSDYDHLLQISDQHDIRVMAILDYANPLYDADASPHTDEGIAAFANWAVSTVKHFKGRGVLWEMYNEPNGFWRPKPDVNAYIKLALATAKAIKQVAPDELHCGPGLSGTDAAWLEPCYKAGLLQYWDAVSVHPYGDEPPETREPHYKGVRALIDRYAPKGKSIPILSGEWGYTAARVPRETQGKFVAREILFNLYSGIPLSIWYDWRDDGPDPKNGEHNFGCVANAYHKDTNPVLDPKPAYLAARTLNSKLAGFMFNRRVALTNDADFLLVFENGKQTRAAAWTTSASPHHVILPAVHGEIETFAFDGRDSGSIQAKAAGLDIELTDGPTYLLPKAAGDIWPGTK